MAKPSPLDGHVRYSTILTSCSDGCSEVHAAVEQQHGIQRALADPTPGIAINGFHRVEQLRLGQTELGLVQVRPRFRSKPRRNAGNRRAQQSALVERATEATIYR